MRAIATIAEIAHFQNDHQFVELLDDLIERRVIAPVDVFHREEDRLCTGKRRDDLTECVEQPSLVRLRISARRRCGVGKKRPELGKHSRELRRSWRENVSHERRGCRRGELADQIHERRIRNRRLALEGRRAQHEESVASRHVDHGAQQARLADARLADEQRNVAIALPRALEHARRSRDLIFATDQRRANDVMLRLHTTHRIRERPSRQWRRVVFSQSLFAKAHSAAKRRQFKHAFTGDDPPPGTNVMNIGQRIFVEDEKVGALTHRERPNIVAHPHHLGGDDGGGANRFEW